MLNFFKETFPDDATLLNPDMVPLNSPDLNPMDFGICSILEQRVYKVKVWDIDYLTDWLGEAWAKY